MNNRTAVRQILSDPAVVTLRYGWPYSGKPDQSEMDPSWRANLRENLGEIAKLFARINVSHEKTH